MPFNAQQLEQCDDSPEDIEYIMRLDTNSGAITHKVHVKTLKNGLGLIYYGAFAASLTIAIVKLIEALN